MATQLSRSLVVLIVLSIVAVWFVGSRLQSLGTRKTGSRDYISSLSASNISLSCPSSRSNYLKPVFNGEGQWSGYYVPMP